jgi:hypothetical protein
MNSLTLPEADIWAARIAACWRASVESIIEVGRLLIAAKNALPHGSFGEMIDGNLPFTASTAQRLMTIAGDQRLSNPAHVQHLPPSWGTLYELTKLPDEEFDAKIKDGTIRPDMMRRDLTHVRPARRESLPTPVPQESTSDAEAEQPQQPEPAEQDVPAPLPNGARSIMSSRQEPDDSLDYFPTPPWATRALMERVLPAHSIVMRGAVREPACGEGHIAEVLREYCPHVYASDIHPYGYSDEILDYLGTDLNFGADWIVTNPPFGDAALDFVDLALTQARVGVAMFFRSQWAVEGIERYERLFQRRPPTIEAYFVERVNLCKGRWDPDGSTATAYCWLVWHHGAAPRPVYRIPPGCREALTRSDDRERFTAHPVIKRLPPAAGVTDDPCVDHSPGLESNLESQPDPTAPDVDSEEPAAVPVLLPPQAAPDDDPLMLPKFLRRVS